MAKQRFLGSLDPHHVLSLPRVHGHDQQRRGMLLFTSCKGWSRLLHIPPWAARSLSFSCISLPRAGSSRSPCCLPPSSLTPSPAASPSTHVPLINFYFYHFCSPVNVPALFRSSCAFFFFFFLARTDPLNSFFKATTLLCPSLSFASLSPLPPRLLCPSSPCTPSTQKRASPLAMLCNKPRMCFIWIYLCMLQLNHVPRRKARGKNSMFGG